MFNLGVRMLKLGEPGPTMQAAMNLPLQKPSGAGEPAAGAIEGCWRSRGYGWILDLRTSRYALYDHTRLGAVPIESGDRSEFAAAFDRIDAHGDQLSAYARGEITRYDFDRVVSLPGPILHGLPDPQLAFEYFWQLFQQDYAFFRLRNVDWNAVYRQYQPLITAVTDPDRLFEVLCAMVAPLEDNHVAVRGASNHFVSDKIADIKALMVRELGLDSPSLGLASTIERYQRLVMERFLRGRGKTAGNRLATWGWVAPGVGYLNLLRFFGFADGAAVRALEDLPGRRADAARLLEADLEAADAVMARVLGDFSNARALIIDVRVNGGGFDRLALHVARWFADSKRVAFSKCARWGDTTTELQPIHIEPAPDIATFAKPVYLLTGERTASAGEVFALALRCLPQVTLVGKRTLGIMSDNLRKYLPNGWAVTLSNEIYSAPDGAVHEGDGIAPMCRRWCSTHTISMGGWKSRLRRQRASRPAGGEWYSQLRNASAHRVRSERLACEGHEVFANFLHGLARTGEPVRSPVEGAHDEAPREFGIAMRDAAVTDTVADPRGDFFLRLVDPPPQLRAPLRVVYRLDLLKQRAGLVLRECLAQYVAADLVHAVGPITLRRIAGFVDLRERLEIALVE